MSGRSPGPQGLTVVTHSMSAQRCSHGGWDSAAQTVQGGCRLGTLGGFGEGGPPSLKALESLSHPQFPSQDGTWKTGQENRGGCDVGGMLAEQSPSLC